MTDEQLPLPLDGLDGKHAGMEQALNAADQWRGEAYRVLILLALKGEPFTSEDVTERAGLPTGEVKTNANNAVGAIMNAAARDGIIRKTGAHVLSRRAASHAASLAQWVGDA